MLTAEFAQGIDQIMAQGTLWQDDHVRDYFLSLFHATLRPYYVISSSELGASPVFSAAVPGPRPVFTPLGNWESNEWAAGSFLVDEESLDSNPANLLRSATEEPRQDSLQTQPPWYTESLEYLQPSSTSVQQAGGSYVNKELHKPHPQEFTEENELLLLSGMQNKTSTSSLEVMSDKDFEELTRYT